MGAPQPRQLRSYLCRPPVSSSLAYSKHSKHTLARAHPNSSTSVMIGQRVSPSSNLLRQKWHTVASGLKASGFKVALSLRVSPCHQLVLRLGEISSRKYRASVTPIASLAMKAC